MSLRFTSFLSPSLPFPLGLSWHDGKTRSIFAVTHMLIAGWPAPEPGSSAGVVLSPISPISPRVIYPSAATGERAKSYWRASSEVGQHFHCLPSHPPDPCSSAQCFLALGRADLPIKLLAQLMRGMLQGGDPALATAEPPPKASPFCRQIVPFSEAGEQLS